MEIRKVVVVCLLSCVVQIALTGDTCSQPLFDSEPAEFNTEYVPSMGDKIYMLKRDGASVRKIDGVINGIKKNRDGTIYMLVGLNEQPSPGTPIFSGNKIVGMVYRQSTVEDLFEAMPVKIVLDFMKAISLPDSGKKSEKETISDSRIAMIRELLKARQYDRALEILRDALKDNEDSAELHGWMGVTMVEMGNAKEAASEFRKALAIEPQNADFHNGLGYAMLAAEDFNEAIASFQKAVRINPMHADAHYGLGRAYAVTGEINLAIKEYTALKELDSMMADNLFQLIIGKGKIETE